MGEVYPKAQFEELLSPSCTFQPELQGSAALKIAYRISLTMLLTILMFVKTSKTFKSNFS